jgi:hypothetical protein
MTTTLFEDMKRVYKKTATALLTKGLVPVVYGSFALCLYAKALVGEPKDIDLAFRSRKEQEEAIEIAQKELLFLLVKEMEWESDAGDRSVNTVLKSPEGVLFDFSYSLGDIQVELNPHRTIDVGGQLFPILSLVDLRRSYQRFAHEKPDADEKIAWIDRLLLQV